MKILDVTFNGVLGVPEERFDLRSPTTGKPATLVLLTGEAASGKTLFLESIIAAKESAGAYGGRQGWRRKRSDAAAAKVSLHWEFSPEERDRFHVRSETVTEAIFDGKPQADRLEWEPGTAEVFKSYDTTRETGKVQYFHARRALEDGAPLTTATPDATLALSPSNLKFVWIEPHLVQSALAAEAGSSPAAARTRRFGEFFQALCPDKEYVGAGEHRGALRAVFRDRSGRLVGLGELSFGEQQAVLFGATMVFCHVSNSVVLVDSPELGLSLPRARALLGLLRSMGADNQIIAATSHVALVEGLHDFVVVRLDGRAKEAAA